MKNNQNNSAPEGYHTITPSLTIKGAADALDFYQRALGATVGHVMRGPGGGVMHAEVVIHGSKVMLSDEFPDYDCLSPQTLGGTPVGLYVYVADADAAFAQAIAAGGKEIMPLSTQFWGDRSGQFLDPFGHKWTVATRVEDVTPEEIARRGDEWTAKMSKTE